MFYHLHRYQTLSTSTIYRHRQNWKRRRISISSDSTSSESENERDDSSEVEMSMAGHEYYASNRRNEENETHFEEIRASQDSDFDEAHGGINHDDNDNADGDSLSHHSETDQSDITSLEDSTSDSDGDDGEGFPNANELIYPGARLTVSESSAAVLKYYLRHSIPDVALCDLLELIEMHCPEENHCVKTLFLFRKWLGKFQMTLQKYFFCSECMIKLLSIDDVCAQCPDPKSTSYFIAIPLEYHLKELFGKPGFYNSLSYRFEREKDNDNNYEDIYDGDLYRSFCNDDAEVDLRSQSNISLQWNSDGFSLYKSANFSVWPQFAMINELPPRERRKPSNMLVLGLWFGTNKPCTNLFLESFADDCRKLREGFEIYVKDLDQEIVLKGVTLCSVCDGPARAMFLNMKQHNAVYGCQKCEIQTVAMGNVRAFKRTENLQLRTAEETEVFAVQTLDRSADVKGVKGPTLMTEILPDFIRCTTIDSMHLLMGIVKLLFKIWLSSEYRDHRASLWEHFQLIQKRICAITPPSFVNRLPRKIDDVAYWKASELIIWLLTYSTGILHDVMEAEYFTHHQSLVLSIYLLSQKSISPNDITKADQLIHGYVSNFRKLYGDHFMTSNLHGLLHMSSLVQDFGPLWVFTCFPFENCNRVIKLLVHATRDSQLQICKGVSLYLTLDTLKKVCVREGSVSEKFCDKLDRSGTHRRKLRYIGPKIAVIGLPKKGSGVLQQLQRLLQRSGYDEKSIYQFQCLFKDGIIYSSQSYKRSTKTNSSCVSYVADNENQIGLIETFLRVNNCRCKNGLCNLCQHTSKTLAVVNKCHSRNEFFADNPNMVVNFIHSLKLTEEKIVIEVLNLGKILCQIKTDRLEKMYAIESSGLCNGIMH